MTTRAENAAHVRVLRSRGLLHREIAAQTGLSRSYVSELLIDPEGVKAFVRREGYRGVCEGCGRGTSGGDGPAAAPKLCVACYADEHRYWTEERVIAAIQEWARRYGSPPISEQWIGTVTADDGYRFPARTSVYRRPNSTRKSQPFESWADAIEVAGFPRPRVGRRRNLNQIGATPMPSNHTRPYLVFASETNNTLKLLGRTEARTTQEAIEQVAKDAGSYAAVAEASLQHYTLAPRLVASRAA